MSSQPRAGGRRHDFDRPRFLYVPMVLALLFLFIPSLVVLVYSFNSEKSLINFYGFSLQWYREAFESETLRASFVVSIQVAAIATVVATALGTITALGLDRARPRLVKYSMSQLILRLLVPETAVAAALFLMFTQAGLELSMRTIIIAHIALCLPFVTILVRNQLAGFPPEIEEAAMDLGATHMGALRLAVIPMISPAIAASAALAFVLSFDNFITSLFMSGTNTPTLPLSIYSMLRFGVSPVVNALGILMMVISGLCAGSAFLLFRVARRLSDARA